MGDIRFARTEQTDWLQSEKWFEEKLKTLQILIHKASHREEETTLHSQ